MLTFIKKNAFARAVRDNFVEIWNMYYFTPISWTPNRVVKRPEGLAGADVCLYVALCVDGKLRDHASVEVKRWHDRGFRVVLVTIVDRMSDADDFADFEYCSGVLIRENAGVDFAAWAAALRVFPSLCDANLVAFVNDSVLSIEPMFGEVLVKVKQSDSDVIGVIESWEFCRHFQSWCIFYRARSLKDPGFKEFWSSVRNYSRFQAIQKYELELLRILELSGLKCESLLSPRQLTALKGPAALLKFPRLFIEAGCCFVKLKVFTQNSENLSCEEIDFCKKAVSAQTLPF